MRRLTLLLLGPAMVAGCRDVSRTQTSSFDGDRALQYVQAQLDFGTRVPGTASHDRTGEWIIAQMRTRADTVIEQRWSHVTAAGDTIRLLNVLARFKPGATSRVLYVTHWDTRPLTDEAQDPAQRRLPMPGANDGASGVALFLSLGDVWKTLPPDVGVDLLFVDGEDYGDFNTDRDVLIGSKYFAGHLPSAGYKPLYGVLFDMIGDRDLKIPHEPNSLTGAPEVVARVWDVAKQLGYDNVFVPESYGSGITDDHVPLLKAGLHIIDVIDLDYCCHHQPTDTIDKLSAHSLKVVGDVAVALVRQEP